MRVNGTTVAVESGVFSATVTLEEGYNAILVVATDGRNNEALATRSLTLDTQPPSLGVESPREGQVINFDAVEVRGRANDELELAAVEIDGRPAALTDGEFVEEAELVEGANEVIIRAFDTAGNETERTIAVSRFSTPLIQITAPSTLSVLASEEVEVTGTVSGEGVSVEVNGVAATVTAGVFTATGVPLTEGRTLIDAVASSPNGAVAVAKSVVFRDLRSPRVVIASPVDGDTLYAPTVHVSGLVNDLVLGTVNAAHAEVVVNGVAAAVENRSFLAQDVELQPGENVISAVATDAAGNLAQHEVRVHYEPSPGARILTASGELQSGQVGVPLPDPLVARVVDAGGSPAAGVPVVFRVVAGGGSLEGERRLVAFSDGSGLASTVLSWCPTPGWGSSRRAGTVGGTRRARPGQRTAAQSVSVVS